MADSRLDRQRALELHREVYTRKGLLPEDTLKPLLLPQACVPGSAIFVAKEHGRIVGTISLYQDSAIGLPMDAVHGEEVDAMRRRLGCVAEVGSLAVLESRRGVGITAMLYLAAFGWAVATAARCIVACVNPSSRRVYSKVLLFDVLGGCKQHPRFLRAPSIPIGLDLTTAPARYREVHGCDLDTFLCGVLPRQTGDLDSTQLLPWPNDSTTLRSTHS